MVNYGIGTKNANKHLTSWKRDLFQLLSWLITTLRVQRLLRLMPLMLQKVLSWVSLNLIIDIILLPSILRGFWMRNSTIILTTKRWLSLLKLFKSEVIFYVELAIGSSFKQTIKTLSTLILLKSLILAQLVRLRSYQNLTLWYPTALGYKMTKQMLFYVNRILSLKGGVHLKYKYSNYVSWHKFKIWLTVSSIVIS